MWSATFEVYGQFWRKSTCQQHFLTIWDGEITKYSSLLSFAQIRTILLADTEDSTFRYFLHRTNEIKDGFPGLTDCSVSPTPAREPPFTDKFRKGNFESKMCPEPELSESCTYYYLTLTPCTSYWSIVNEKSSLAPIIKAYNTKVYAFKSRYIAVNLTSFKLMHYFLQQIFCTR